MTQMIGPGMMAQQTVPCDVCSGEGVRVLKPCKTCHSKKFVEREKVLEIQIRPGMQENQTLVFSGECSDSAEYEHPGDVVLSLKRADQPTEDMDSWQWKGNDLWIRKRITFAESVIGFKKSLENHPSGKTLIVGWRKGAVVHGATLQAPGWGMPIQGGGFGTCFVQIHVDAPEPKEWSPEEREKLRELLGGDVQTIDTEEVIALQPSN
jgi:DnaJ-class molecular chaperone